MKLLLYTLLVTVSILAADIKEIKKTYAVKNSQTIELLGFHGSTIDIKSWEKNEIALVIKVEYSSSDKQKEREYFQKVDVLQEEIGERLVISYKEPKSNDEEFSFSKFFKSFFSSYTDLNVTGEIYLPSSAKLNSDMRYGSFSFDGIKGTIELSGVANTLSLKNCQSVQKIENNYGTTTIDHCGGKLNLDSESSKIFVNDFNGSINADANYSTVKLNGITTELKVTCSSGNIDVDDVGGNIFFSADYSKINATNVKGSVVIESQSGTIRVKNINGVNIKAPYSNISVETVNGAGSSVNIQNTSGQIDLSNIPRDIIINDSYSKIKLSNIQGNVSVEGNGSVVHGRMITGNLIVNNEYGDIRMDELSASTVEIINKSNTVDIELLTKPLKIDVKNEYGPVYVSFPEFSGDVRLKASYGKIKTNLPIEAEEIGGGAIAMGKVGNGTGTINIKTVSGDIDVQQKK